MDVPLARPLRHTVGAERDLLDVRRVGHHADRDRGTARHFGSAGAVACAGVEQRLHGRPPPAPDLHAMTGLDKVEGHGPAHETESDESDIHWVMILQR